MKSRLALILLPLMILVLVGCSDSDDPTDPAVAAYVGSATCSSCHETDHTEWEESGHPYKLTAVDGGPPTDAFPDHAQFPNDVVGPPDGYTWDDVTYTIGGFGWKMRWMDAEGLIITSGGAGDLVQYNFESDAWGTYNDVADEKPYDCGKCHTTGWIYDEDWETDGTLDDNQDGLRGIHGTFTEGGIGCEACHGPGSLHADDPDGIDMGMDSSSELCGQCHTRDAEHRIPAKGGFIKHHEQYDEWLHSPHGGLNGPGCNDCHDPHASVKFDDVAAGEGVKADASCESCHSGMTLNHSSMATCTDCHMPEASKSAVAVHEYQGDIKTHIWAINTAAVGKDDMFTPAGDFVLLDVEDQAQITLDFACYSCHKDEGGIGGEWSQQDLDALSAKAIGIHTPVISAR